MPLQQVPEKRTFKTMFGKHATNTGIIYEIMTRRIFQDILNQNSVKTIEVEHSVTIQGKTAKHQIDVYWKFEMNGLIYETIVQTKDWSQPVQQGQLLQFKAVIDDIPGSPKGVFVTRTGYQSGAKDYAEAHGIVLYELREPNEADLDGTIKEMRVQMNLRIPVVEGHNPIPDIEWVKAEKERLDIRDQELRISIDDRSDRIFFQDENGSDVISLYELGSKLVPSEPESPSLREHMFATPLYIPSGSAHFPRIRCLGLSVITGLLEATQEIILNVENSVPFILKNVLTGDVKIISE